jgi:hypothetical protein
MAIQPDYHLGSYEILSLLVRAAWVRFTAHGMRSSGAMWR